MGEDREATFVQYVQFFVVYFLVIEILLLIIDCMLLRFNIQCFSNVVVTFHVQRFVIDYS